MSGLTAELVARALGGDVYGNYVMCPGPNHGPKDRSLKVTIDDDAPDGFVVHSFSTDDWKAAKDWVRTQLRLNPHEAKPRGQHTAGKTNGKVDDQRIVAEYIYQQADDTPYLRVQRTAGKQFPQSHWTGLAWSKGAPKGDPIPYRLPALNAADVDDVVFIVEGEKDADTATRCGQIATTNPMGAMNWPASFGPYFQGRRVCIIPDNDPPDKTYPDGKGMAHARDVAAKLDGVAADIRIVPLPGLPPKGDLSDWLDDTDAKLEELFRLYDAAPVYRQHRLKPDKPAGLLDVQPYVFPDAASIPVRRFIYGRFLSRGFISLTTAPGGFGKTMINVCDAIAITSQRKILHESPHERCGVWLHNGEDPQDELDRRIAAVMAFYGISKGEIGDRLLVTSGLATPLVIATQTQDGVQIIEPVVEAVIAVIERCQIGVIQIDPFVSSHSVSENDNNAIDRVVKGGWGQVVYRTGCAVHLTHHSRKTGGEAVTLEDTRGGSALLAAVRAGRTINVMSEAEASKANIRERFQYVRLDDGKANLAPRSTCARWLRLNDYELPNGDRVGVPSRWAWPDQSAGISMSDLADIQNTIAIGRWRKDAQSAQWAGRVIGDVLGIDADTENGKDRIKELLKKWIDEGYFVEAAEPDENRHKKTFIKIGRGAET